MKFVCLMSSGLDSPVAGFLMSKFGDCVFLHTDNRPYTDANEVANFHKLSSQLKDIFEGSILQSYVVPHGETLKKITSSCRQKFTCVICKRMMLRYAENIATKEKADAIVTGDSLGQVASQTLHNLRVEQEALSSLVFRPLIGMDKQEIIDIARDIGTYTFSILPSQGCSAVPKKPAIHANLKDVKKQEQKLDVSDLVQKAVRNDELFML